ncbi:hypothetical protein ETH98_01310 [Macrococcoides caseolyticum]|uniref:hypothetical protein n=1 Tax=Macrococcoides caseolyticum TaxID=69966 RepID=UPI00105F90E0|nr:hypothetical protein [Macrococcus caseolyticus]TDM31252.1 hypothetical protein ETH98_01310 [Macrococcus caseolyticus]
MPKVYVDKGTVIHKGQAYFRQSLDLTQEEYENVKDLVTVEDATEKSYKDLDVEELKALVEEKGLEVVATGKNGAVKVDYVKALEEAAE